MKYKLGDVSIINPRETIKKGTIAKKVDMAVLQPFTRKIPSFELLEYKGGTKFRNGDTIMARITPCLENGKTSQVSILDDNEIGFGSTEYIVFRAKEGISDCNFLYYLVCSDIVRDPAIKSMVGSSGRQRVQTDVIQNLEIDLPSLEIQKQIASILSALDEKIEFNNRINENLEQQIQTILLDLIKSDSQKDSIENVKLGDYLYIKGRIGWKGLKKDEYLESSDYRIINGESLTKDGIDWGKAGYISAERYDESPEIMLQIGDILLSKDGTIGKIGYIDRLDSPSTVASGIFVIRNIKPDIISTQFIYYLLKSKLFTAFIASRTEGSVIPHLYQKDFMEFMIPLPNAAEMNQFDSLTLPLFSTIVKNLRENEFLAATRDVLLPKLMKGEIDVSEIKI
ncbi:restriction endonuclease subunit S [Ruminococcus callidus]|uniref:restriction endonuclease subunit S n=2 Tax=Ruminococcus TaxID=1263 RepID=UPI003520CA04